MQSQLPEAMLLSLDFAKAYDKVQWLFIQKTLECPKLGPVFREFVSRMYQNMPFAVTIDEQIILRFLKSRGVQRGEPISPFLFHIQMISPCKVAKIVRVACAIWLSHRNLILTGSFFTDDSLFNAKLADSACQHHKAVEQFCQGLGV